MILLSPGFSQHNLIAIAGVAAFLGVRAAMKKHNVPGRLVLIGTPAEEGGSGKVKLLELGAYKGLDACMMLHPGPGGPGVAQVGSSLAIQVRRLGRDRRGGVACRTVH